MKPSKEAVERAAIASLNTYYARNGLDMNWERATEKTKAGYRLQAEAALTAAMEPTDDDMCGTWQQDCTTCLAKTPTHRCIDAHACVYSHYGLIRLEDNREA